MWNICCSVSGSLISPQASPDWQVEVLTHCLCLQWPARGQGEEAPWLPLHKTLEMALGWPCCCSSSPISPRHAIVSPPLGIHRTHLIRIASTARSSEPAPRHKDILPPHPPPKLPTGSLCRKGSKLPSRSDVLLGPRLPRQDRLPWRVDQILISTN